MVVQGEFEFTIGGETKMLKQGDAYVIPGGVEHSGVGSSGWSLALDIFSPPREDYK
jgi:quercetin dioxygenase-like cupin family protein